MLKVVRAKLHAIRVTGADLNYFGSIMLDPEHCTEAGISPLEFVEIWNKHSGARLSTYVIYGEPGSRCCILNGAAARTCQVGDEIIIATSSFVQLHDLYTLEPRVLILRPDNSIAQRLSYQVFESASRKFDVRILEHGAGKISRHPQSPAVTFARAAHAHEEKPSFTIACPRPPGASDSSRGGCGGPGTDAGSGAAGRDHGRADGPFPGRGPVFRSEGPSPSPAALGRATQLRANGRRSALGRRGCRRAQIAVGGH